MRSTGWQNLMKSKFVCVMKQVMLFSVPCENDRLIRSNLRKSLGT